MAPQGPETTSTRYPEEFLGFARRKTEKTPADTMICEVSGLRGASRRFVPKGAGAPWLATGQGFPGKKIREHARIREEGLDSHHNIRKYFPPGVRQTT